MTYPNGHRLIAGAGLVAALDEILRLQRIEWVHEATLTRLRNDHGDEMVNKVLSAAQVVVDQVHPESCC